VVVRGYEFSEGEESVGLVLDLETGEMKEIQGWSAESVVADGDTIYGIVGGDIVTADLETGVVKTLVTLPTQSAGPLILLGNDSAVTTTTTEIEPGDHPGPPPTTPPLLAPELGSERPLSVTTAWIAGISGAFFAGVLIWLSLPRRDRGEKAD
jgi:hypothetical protein